jgi:hypothetical protein
MSDRNDKCSQNSETKNTPTLKLTITYNFIYDMQNEDIH